MKDLTHGSILRHILEMSAPMAIGMLVQTVYFMVDLYFVARQGGAALAGVGAAGNFAMAVMALTDLIAATGLPVGDLRWWYGIKIALVAALLARPYL